LQIGASFKVFAQLAQSALILQCWQNLLATNVCWQYPVLVLQESTVQRLASSQVLMVRLQAELLSLSKKHSAVSQALVVLHWLQTGVSVLHLD
jgi:hypothetical protein